MSMNCHKSRLEGDIDWQHVIAEYGPMVSVICRRMISDPDTAKDAAQEVWLEITRSIDSFNGLSRLSTWIYTVASRVVARAARQENHYSLRFLRDYFHQPEYNVASIITPEHRLWVKEMCDRCLTGTLHCLDNESRLAYIFRDIANLPYEEIAQILEKSEARVRQTISRGRRRLQRFLRDECVLYNPGGNCRCRMRSWVEAVDLPEEYDKIRRIAGRIGWFKKTGHILPQIDFWDRML